MYGVPCGPIAYADDVTLFSALSTGLQKQIDYCLLQNVALQIYGHAKTKVMVSGVARNRYDVTNLSLESNYYYKLYLFVIKSRYCC